ncbi:hypothetical protein CEP54_015959 [Fusarium duplospermum]|uniref:Uncharacterized protein n=1 Tax=Fusarium duplospermum TaxID=1325734 RepID=A0A428NJJ4_9HYPO|nr:hypothetical protein CEP54_015959 [Fusarium duplospermum]
MVLLGLPHVMTTPHNRLLGSEGSLRGFPPSCNCLTGSQLLASTGVSSSTTQSRLDFHPPTFPLYIAILQYTDTCLPTGERGRALSDTAV